MNRIKQATRFSGGGGSELVAAGDPARETAGALLSVIPLSTRSETGDIYAGDAELGKPSFKKYRNFMKYFHKTETPPVLHL